MNRSSASSRRSDLKKSITNIASECRSANIVGDHAMILPDDATPERMGFSETTTHLGSLHSPHNTLAGDFVGDFSNSAET
jgi:hypothetical protein